MKSVCLWSRAQLGTRYIQKGDLFLVTGPPIKFDSCFWILRKDEKRIKVNLYLDLEESQWQLLSYKNISQTTSKTFAKQCFFTDHLKHTTVNETNCRATSENPPQLCTH